MNMIPARFTGLPGKLTALIAVFTLISPILPVYSNDDIKPDLVWPLSNSYTISSSFGEYRPGHVHMGLDIRSRDHRGNAVTGLPVLAIEGGFISRMKVKPGGYGRALYLTLHDGRTAVYAHLESFTGELENYLEDKQWISETFKQDIFPPNDIFTFNKGDTIAYSGRSGTKYPHLHFEIRSPAGIALNPLSQSLEIPDQKRPVFTSFAAAPLDASAEIDGDCRPKAYSIYGGKDGIYYLRGIPEIYGKTSLSIDCHDRTDNAPNAVSVYRLELFIDGVSFFTIQYDSCDFYSYLQIEIDRDPYLNRNRNDVYQRLFKIEGNDMPFYSGDGVLNTDSMEPGIKKISIAAEDFYGNSAKVIGKIKIVADPVLLKPEPVPNFTGSFVNGSPGSEAKQYRLEFFHDYLRLESPDKNPAFVWRNGMDSRLAFKQSKSVNIARIPLTDDNFGFNYLTDENGKILEFFSIEPVTPESGGALVSPDKNFKVIFPPGSVYRKMYAAVKELNFPDLGLEYEAAFPKVYHLEPQWVPLKNTASLVWNYPGSDPQAGVYYLENGVKPVFLGNRSDSLTVTGDCLNLETIVLLYDREPPVCELTRPRRLNKMTDKLPVFSFTLDDLLSGIDSETVAARIDGEWILTEYDPPRDAAYAKTREPLTPGEHTLQFTAADKCGNVAVLEYQFNLGE